MQILCQFSLKIHLKSTGAAKFSILKALKCVFSLFFNDFSHFCNLVRKIE